ncbi:hypothetical protein K7X08_035167 [Anisodus acutangulus]|uniref:Uncharacterized protein n=1 Tax=Anisodus acutangulus TaxID=402998 RepID=A0A9Q1LIH9_9SOLA|nr:hypothetical protein K7X08_035167 [Anisodus acutangulus]
MSIPSQISDDENKLDIAGLEVRLQHSLDTLQSICSVDDICSVSFLEKSSDPMEDSGFSQGKCHCSTDFFPLLEVDEAGLGIVSDNSTKEKVLIFENIELQCETPGSDGMGNINELLDSTKFDTLQHLSNVSTKLLKDGKFSTEGVSTQCSSKKASLFGDSWSEFNDLDFFLNPKEYGRDKDYKPAYSSIDTNAMGQSRFLSSATTLVQPQQWNIKVHQVSLSSDNLLLIDELRKIFQVIFERWRELIETQDPSQAVDDIAILCLSKKQLINLIKKRSVCRTSLFQDGDNTMSLVTLFAVKQMVWYLCYYGLHTTYLYIEKLYRSFQGLDSKLDFLYNFIKDVHQKGEKDMHKFHPSLSVIKDILQECMSKGSSKILVVAEPVFWWSLKKLFTSMNISYSQPQNGQKNDCYKLEDASMQMIHESRCCLVTQDPPVVGNLPHSFSTLNEIDVTFEELLNFLPVEKNFEDGSMETLLGNEACSAAAQHAMFSLRSVQNRGGTDGCPETIIIVNTHNFDKEMVISRRSTYQKILAFEKKGVQVVERDLRQTVDIIVSASACLVWYDCKTIAKKATAADEAFSCLPLCVENIAASILTSLSLAFSGCILVFEGESDFISGIMESSDELYAAAASLGMDIQIFYSYSSEMTDEIILSCIELSFVEDKQRALF